MELPEEVVVWYLIPALRKEIVIALKNSRLSQKDIAAKLGITEAAISQYLHHKRATQQINFTPDIRKEITASAARIKTSSDKRAAAEEIVRLVGISKQEKLLCSRCGLNRKSCELCVN